MEPIKVLEALKLGKEIEYRYLDCDWVTFNQTSPVGALTSGKYSFRIKPREMITIGDVSFPKPETVRCPIDTEYYFPCLEVIDLYSGYTWTNDQLDYNLLLKGILHLSKENAIAHAKALIKLSGGSYE